jgi:hypothetical protein
MKKLYFSYSIKTLSVMLIALTCSLILTSCEKSGDNQSTPMTVTQVYLQDRNSSVPDRPVDFVRLQQIIRIEGSGFTGLRRIYINGYSCYFNPVYVSDNSVLVSVSKDVPIMDADEGVRNTIRLTKDNAEVTFNISVRASAPSITRISHTMPKAGEEITLYGSGLLGVTKVVFPGDVVVTEGILSDDEDGRFCIVTVPAGVSDEGGSVYIEGANGSAYSPAYFNFKKGLIHNFDDVSNAAWSTGKVSDDLSDVIPAAGNGPKSQGVYRSLNKDGEVMSANDAPVDVSRYWIKNSVWPSIISESVISWGTPASEVAIQMDIYYEGEWVSGDIRFVVADGWGASRYCMIYAPWVVNGSRVEVENPGSWFTITLPFSDSNDFKDKELSAVMEQIAAASYDQAGPWFENGNISDVQSVATTLNVYFDNIRIVPLTTPESSDFPDEEEAE